MTREMQARFWQHGQIFKFPELNKKATWFITIKFINITQLNREITSIISPPYFFRTQNVGFRKQICISYSVSTHKREDGRLKFPIYKHLKHREKCICGKCSSKKYSIISEQRYIYIYIYMYIYIYI